MNLFHACSVVLSYIQQTRIPGEIFAFRSINFFIDNIINTKPFSPFLEQSPGEFWLQSLLKQDISSNLVEKIDSSHGNWRAEEF